MAAINFAERKQKKENAFALYMLGLKGKEIGLKVGVPAWLVRQWATRAGWPKIKADRAKSNLALVDAANDAAITNAISLHQQRETKVYEGHLDRLAALNPKKPSEFVQASVALKNYSDVARRNLGMTEGESGSTKNTFNFNLAGVQVGRKSTKSADSSDAIEVKTTEVIDNQ